MTIDVDGLLSNKTNKLFGFVPVLSIVAIVFGVIIGSLCRKCWFIVGEFFLTSCLCCELFHVMQNIFSYAMI
jgi:hypothetical protein